MINKIQKFTERKLSKLSEKVHNLASNTRKEIEAKIVEIFNNSKFVYIEEEDNTYIIETEHVDIEVHIDCLDEECGFTIHKINEEDITIWDIYDVDILKGFNTKEELDEFLKLN